MKWISIIAFIASVLACVYVLLRCEPVTADWLGILVGVLTLLVTLLVGWQIWQTVDMRSKIDSVDDKIKKSREEYDHEISGALYHIYSINYMLQNQYNSALRCLINGVKEQNKSNNPIYLKNILRSIDEQFDKFDISSKQERLDFISLLEQTECKDDDANKFRIILLDKLKE